MNLGRLPNSIFTDDIVGVGADSDSPNNGAPGVLGILGEWLFIFRELGSTGNYFRDLGSKLIILGI